MRLFLLVALLALGAGACVTVPPTKPDPVVVVPEPPPEPEPPPPEPPPPESAPSAPPEPPPPVSTSTSEQGMASYYANRFEGRRTASGERYRKKLPTCAHREHPFGTILVVTAVKTGKSTTCRVNDRGPYKKSRVLDVSRSVARDLDMLGPGVLEVRIDVETTPAATPVPSTETTAPET